MLRGVSWNTKTRGNGPVTQLLAVPMFDLLSGRGCCCSVGRDLPGFEEGCASWSVVKDTMIDDSTT